MKNNKKIKLILSFVTALFITLTISGNDPDTDFAGPSLKVKHIIKDNHLILNDIDMGSNPEGKEMSFHSEDTTGIKKTYYKWPEIVDQLNKWATKNPNLCRLDTAGFTQLDRPILLLKISGSPETAPRQRIFISGATHGNEPIGVECAMGVAEYLISNYPSDPDVKAIVDRSEFLVIPVLCADGFINPSRTLKSGKNPNRAFGYQAGYTGQDDASWPNEWPEMRAYRDLLQKSSWYLSIDYHSGVLSVLIPFFCSINSSLDSTSYRELGMVYANASGIKSMGRGLGGSSMGVSVDFAYGKAGTIAFLPEVYYGKGPTWVPPVTYIDSIVSNNVRAVIATTMAMQRGLRGKITGSGGKPLYARIMAKGKGAPVYSDPKSGYFFKYFKSSGNAEVTVIANGYLVQSREVTTDSTKFADLNFKLRPDKKSPFTALSVDEIRTRNRLTHSQINSILGIHDNLTLPLESLDSTSFVNLDLGPSTPARDKKGFDFTVYASENAVYSVSAADNLNDLSKAENLIGKGNGTTSFDLSTIKLRTTRFIQISVKGTSADIDAVEAVNRRKD